MTLVVDTAAMRSLAALAGVLVALSAVACDDARDPPAGSRSAAQPTPSPAARRRGEPPVRRLTIAVSGDLLPHLPVVARARALAGGAGYDFAPLLRRLRPSCAARTRAVPRRDAARARAAGGLPELPHAAGARARDPRHRLGRLQHRLNHTVDAGQAGVESTIRALNRARVRHTGSYASRRAPAGR